MRILTPLAFHEIGIPLKAHTSLSFLVIFFLILPAILKPLFVSYQVDGIGHIQLCALSVYGTTFGVWK